MYQKKPKRLVEVCPQCFKSIDSSSNRLVHDSCGHWKCRICLIQEVRGCLLCGSETNVTSTAITSKPEKPIQQQRKSVITSLADQIAEQKQADDIKNHEEPVDKDTCHIIKQSLEKDILFPDEIVKKSTGNFYHLKRIFSQRFFNEDKNKQHKACETEENWKTNTNTNTVIKEDETHKKNSKIPNHIEVQYYCSVHKISFQQKDDIFMHHMTCGKEDQSKTNEKSSNNQPFRCKLCDKSFKDVSKLNRHVKTHTKESKFTCSVCGKPCTDNHALKVHERTHAQIKPYTCKYCDRKFSGSHNFKRHERKHRDERKFICDDCGFRFLTANELKNHKVTHSNVKSFVCSICSNQFTFKRTLVRHMRTHDDNPTMIQCKHCDSTFKRKDNLERHVKNAHSEQRNESSTLLTVE